MIEIITGDITNLKVDVIVNAANNRLLGGGGVDGAIHQAAGPRLLQACRDLNGCHTGEAKITPGFKLPSRYVIHTVGPVWQGGKRKEKVLLESSYRNSFEIAAQYQFKTIAFPAISTGVYAYPKAEAACIAVSVMQEYEAQFDRILAVCFKQTDTRYYLDCLNI